MIVVFLLQFLYNELLWINFFYIFYQKEKIVLENKFINSTWEFIMIISF